MKKVILKSILSISVLFSHLAFAESILLKQAQELETGSSTVLINIDQSIQILKQAANQGEAEAFFRLSKYYSPISDYRYLPENSKLYKELRFEAAQRGNFDAYLSLSLEGSVAEGFGIPNEIQGRLKKLQPQILKLAEQGDVKAIETLVYAIDTGAKDYNYEQCQWLYKAVQKGDTLNAGASIQNCPENILKKLGAKTKQEYKKDFKENDLANFNMLQKLSKQGNIDAKIKLVGSYDSESYLSDKDKDRLENEILGHYQKQAAKGASDAYLILALKKESEKDKKALYEKAAELNNHVALSELGSDYLWPEDEKQKNIKKGLLYLEKAAAQNDPDAINFLGAWYYNEENEEHDESLAMQYFKKAAQLGSVNAMDNLARIEEEPEDYRWAVLAYENGSSEEDTQSKALVAYQTGKGTKKDLVKAKKLKTYIQNRAQFNNNLGDMLKSLNEYGKSTDQEPKNRKR